jgi:alkylation response protein AidB-like acyl-CoA dehydrogenase
MAEEKQEAGQRAASKPQASDRDLQQRVADLELQLAQSRATAPLGTIPEHSAGVGDEVAETWGQYDQGLAYAGEHPDQNGD